jgi:hypothetical protein
VAQPPPSAVHGDDAERRRGQWLRCFAVALVGVALAGVATAVATGAWRGYLPGGDVALIDLRVRDTWFGGLQGVPLVGVYSRFGWNHPGPAMFWAIAPLSLVAGGASWATIVGAALVQGVAITLAASLAWRRGGFGFLLAVLAIEGLMYTSNGAEALVSPWNPYVAVAFLPLFILLVWSASLGATGSLIGSVIVGSFLVQTHVGYAVLVVVAFVWLGATALADRSRHSASARWSARGVAIACGAGALMWLPPLIDQATHDPGNLTKLWKYFVAGGAHGHPVGLLRAAGILAAEFTVPPPWLGGGEPVNRFVGEAATVSTLWLMIPAALLVLGYLAARRSGRCDRIRLVVLVGLLNGAGVVTISRVTGGADVFLFYWRTPLALFVLLAVGSAVAGWVNTAEHRTAWRLGGVALVGCVVATSVSVSWDVATGAPVLDTEPVIRQLVSQLDAEGFPRDPTLVRFADNGYRGVGIGVFDELDRRGVPVRVDTKEGYRLGSFRTITPDRARAVWYVVEAQQSDTMATRSGARVLARSTPLNAGDDRELVRLQSQLRIQLEEAGRADLIPALDSELVPLLVDAVPGIDKTAALRVAHFNQKVSRSGRCRCAIVAFSSRAPVLTTRL